jgi:CHAT domain-containing protein
MMTRDVAPPDKLRKRFIGTTIEDLKNALEEDAAFVVFLNGGARGALLWVTRSGASVFPTASPSEVRDDIKWLRGAVTRRAPLNEIESASQKLSIDLFSAMSTIDQPVVLHVLSGDLDAVPWSVLHWPKNENPLIEGTVISTVTLVRPVDRSNNDLSAPLYVISADQREQTDSRLPTLDGIEGEVAAIRSTAAGHEVVRLDGHAANPVSVLELLRKPGAWLHIAAHGVAQPERIGYAGIWLDASAPPGNSRFLGWLDIIDQGAKADLVVLDSCDLGNSGVSGEGGLSFASAILEAGAKNVIASMWPLSDAASSVWVPTFYMTVTSSANLRSPVALHAAQLKLRETRMFRHPFYWAGLQAFTRVEIHPAELSQLESLAEDAGQLRGALH